MGSHWSGVRLPVPGEKPDGVPTGVPTGVPIVVVTPAAAPSKPAALAIRRSQRRRAVGTVAVTDEKGVAFQPDAAEENLVYGSIDTTKTQRFSSILVEKIKWWSLEDKSGLRGCVPHHF